MIREAETRDIPGLIELSLKHFSAVRKMSGEDPFTEDKNVLAGALIETLVTKMADKNAYVGVCETGGVLAGMLIGAMVARPAYFKNRVLGNIESLFPISFEVSKLTESFRKWAQERGATAITASFPPRNETAIKFCERRKKMQKSACQFMKIVGENEDV